MTATLGEMKKGPHTIERKHYLCGVHPTSPVFNLAFKVQVHGLAPMKFEEKAADGTKHQVERYRYKAIEFPHRIVRYANETDTEGFPLSGKVNELSLAELQDLKRDIGRQVVRWRGREHAEGKGVGPNQTYTDGRILETHDFEGNPKHSYIPMPNDEPLMKYIVIRPIGNEELSQRSFKKQEEDAGWNVFDFGDAEGFEPESTEPISKAEIQAQISALQKKLKEQDQSDLDNAIASESEAMKEPGAKRQKRNQARKK